MTHLSREFYVRVKASPISQARFASAVDLAPATLSRYLARIERVRYGHPRLVQIGRLLGLSPDEVFEAPGAGSSTAPQELSQ